MVHVNGFYNHRRRGTWCHPRSGRWYELDGFLMKNRHRHKHVKKISTIGEATISDHKPKLMKFQMDVDMRKKERVKRIPRIRFEKLRIEGIAEQYRQKIGDIIENNVDEDNLRNEDMTRWNELTDIVVEAAK